MSYLVSRSGYNGFGDIPTTVKPLSAPYVIPPKPPAPPKPEEPAWWEKLLGVGGSVLTSYSTTQAAQAQANLLAQQQAAAYGLQPQGSSLTKYALIGGAALVAVLLLKRKR